MNSIFDECFMLIKVLLSSGFQNLTQYLSMHLTCRRAQWSPSYKWLLCWLYIVYLEPPVRSCHFVGIQRQDAVRTSGIPHERQLRASALRLWSCRPSNVLPWYSSLTSCQKARLHPIPSCWWSRVGLVHHRKDEQVPRAHIRLPMSILRDFNARIFVNLAVLHPFAST